MIGKQFIDKQIVSAMSPGRRRRLGPKPIGLMVVILVVASTLIVSARSWFPNPSASGKPDGEAAATQTPEPLKVIQVTVRPEGFEPAEITVPKGKYILVVLNRTGLSDLSAQLSRVVGNRERLRGMQVEKRKNYRWYGLIDLPPGEYVLGEESNSDWVCRIVAENN